MTHAINRLEQLPPTLRKAVDDLVARAREVAGEQLLGVTLFGPFLLDRDSPPYPSLRSAMVFQTVDLEQLKGLGKHGPGFASQQIAAPLVMTPAYIQASLDSFPLEMLEIQHERATVFGRDFFADLALSEANVRLECERDLKTILIGMHQGVLSAALDPPSLAVVQWHAVATLLRTLAGLVWLKDTREPLAPEQIVARAEALAGRSLTGVRRALFSMQCPNWVELKVLYEDVDALYRLVDAW